MLSLSHSGYNYSKKRCERVVNWFMNEYIPRHKISINVHHRGMYRDGVYGWVWPTDCNHRPREFEIEMHNFMTHEHYTKTLLHECWHIHQHIKGDLKDKHGKRLWCGIDCSQLDYEDQPWEQEAHQMEDILFEEYIRDNEL